MTGFFAGQLDYIFFLHGLAFIILAAVCFYLRKSERERLPWGLLGLFGLTAGMNEWLELFVTSLGESSLLDAVRVSVMILSFLFLLEFGRSSVLQIHGKGPGRWVFLPLLALTAGGGLAAGWDGLEASSRYTLGFTGGLWTALALFTSSRKRRLYARRSLMAGSLSIGLYAVATGAVVPCLPYFPASLINNDTFLQIACLILPIHLIRCLFAAGASISIYVYSQVYFKDETGPLYFASRFKYLIWLSILSTIFVLGAGWTATQYFGNRTRNDLKTTGETTAETIFNHLNTALKEVEHGATAMAGSPWIAPALISGRLQDIVNANSVLDRYQKSLDASVCYLLNVTGKVIASSNHHRPDSFLGKSYAFRSYFRQAMEGKLGQYLAVDIVSGDRAYYASFPVFNREAKIIGATVIKKNLDTVEMNFSMFSHAYLIDPQGIIFLGSRPEMRGKGMWLLKKEIWQNLSASRQFGKGPFLPVMSEEPIDGREVVIHGRHYLVTRRFIDQKWSIVLFHPTALITLHRLLAIIITFTFCILNISFFIGTQRTWRSAAEIASCESRFRIIFEGAPVAIFTVDQDTHRILSANAFMAGWLGYRQDELLSMTFDDLRIPGEMEGQECQYRRKDHTLLYVEEIKTSLLSLEKGSILVIAHDITDRKRAEEMLQRLSSLDGLTEIANRRKLDEYLDREWKRAIRTEHPLSLIMCDIDFFKDYNDAYGHLKGDECLKKVAMTLCNKLRRPGDLVARYGGEEFVAILPDTEAEDAGLLAEALRTGVEALGITHSSSSISKVVTISLGVATLIPQRDSSPDQLIMAADQALYQAKRDGRNQVVSRKS